MKILNVRCSHGHRPLGVLALIVALCTGLGVANAEEPIYIGLDADMSKGAAQGGESIRRGLVIAMEQINAAGGVLGRPLGLIVQDHRGIPARGVDNITAFGRNDAVVAVVGGLHTPVALAELPTIHEHQLIYLDPWAAGTPIVDNGYEPNYVFRVSVRDELAGGFLVDAARRRGHRHLGLLLWRTGWGRSNETAIKEAVQRHENMRVDVQWFNTGQRSVTEELKALREAGADVVILVANPIDGRLVIRNIAELPESQRRPVISHWGITGGDFWEWTKDSLAKIDLNFLQTYSFLRPPAGHDNTEVLAAYCKLFRACAASEVVSPVGTAHAYDLLHLLARAIEAAGTTERSAVRSALETLGPYKGLVRTYNPAFTPQRHDALDASDFQLSRYGDNGVIEPARTP